MNDSPCQHDENEEQTLASIIAKAEEHCQTQGLRLTAKRKQVLSGLISSKKALSAYELIDFCKVEFGKPLPAMTVYRILKFLEGEHLVHKLNLANKYVACSHISCGHEHSVPQFLICEACNKVEEFSIPQSTITELETNVKEAGYHLISPQLEMNCVCNDCHQAS